MGAILEEFLVLHKITKFTTKVTMDREPIYIVENTKLLGTHITNDLTWDLNTNYIVKKANARVQLLTNISTFGASREDMIQVICEKCP